ncbi:MAG: potassium-transporting ATPase subunit KdpC [Armatimonadetes bacterium]|nr:potassium-transporting ATPase subunit KdpC [Armatimonadota bacterium]
MFKQVLPSIRATIALAVLTGLLFPLLITGIAQAVFPSQANGSLIKSADGRVIGSRLIGQPFSRPEHFHPRPSAAGSGYDPTASGGTNLGPTSAKLIEGLPDDRETKDSDESYSGVKQLAERYRQENGLPAGAPVPVDAVTRSASGLDPHISVANALLQAPRVAMARGLAESDVVALVRRHTEGRDLGLLGEPRVNVLLLNLELDRLRGAPPSSKP